MKNTVEPSVNKLRTKKKKNVRAFYCQIDPTWPKFLNPRMSVAQQARLHESFPHGHILKRHVFSCRGPYKYFTINLHLSMYSNKLVHCCIRILNLMFNHCHRSLMDTPDRRQSKTLIVSTNVDQRSLETEFLIAICRPTGNKWQSKTLFLGNSSDFWLLRAFSIAAYPVWWM